MDELLLDFASLAKGRRVAGIAYALRIERRVARNDKPYFDFQLRDHRHRVVTGRKWDIVPDESYACPGLIYVEGEATEYRGDLQLRIRRCEERDGDDSPFVPRPYRPLATLAADLDRLLMSIEDPALAAIFDRWPTFSRQLGNAAASMRYHGAYPGGLLEHTVNVAKICDRAAGIYAGVVDRDLLLTGALLHDVGKIDAYDPSGSTGRTDDELLLGHIVRGVLLVRELTEGIPGLSPKRRQALLHLIASHHGQKEWGAATEPASIEAFILHYADQTDATVTGLRDAARDAVSSDRWVFFPMRKTHVIRPDTGSPDQHAEADGAWEDEFSEVPF